MKIKNLLNYLMLSLLIIALLIPTTLVYATSEDTSNIYCSHKNSGLKIALTFDDGPHPVHTPVILDILSEYNVKATFFVVGANVGYFPNLIRRQLREGHEIGNHTYSHADLRKLKPAEIRQEILSTENMLYETAEYRCKLLRPPGGLYTSEVSTLTTNLDYRIVLWTVDTLDWKHTPTDQIVNTVLSNIKSGDIILMHDFIANDSPTPAALRILIPKLQQMGFSFVTVSELITSP